MTARRSLAQAAQGSCIVQSVLLLWPSVEGIARTDPSESRVRPCPDEHVASVVEIYDALPSALLRVLGSMHHSAGQPGAGTFTRCGRRSLSEPETETET